MQLTEDEREQLAQREGNEFRKVLITATVRPAWVRATDDQRRNEIAAIRREISARRPAIVTKFRKDATTKCAAMRFEEFLERYKGMADEERKIADPVQMNRVIAWRRKVLNGEVSADDQSRIQAKLSTINKK